MELIWFIISVIHLLSCFWILLAHCDVHWSDEEYEVTWMHKKGIFSSSALTKYINGIYFSATTMITVGYGDITPESLVEKFSLTLTMLLSCGI